MKTAISLPDETFHRATERASELGISRSEFFARAAERYLKDLDGESLTEQINQALEAMEPDDLDEVVASAGRRGLAETEW